MIQSIADEPVETEARPVDSGALPRAKGAAHVGARRAGWARQALLAVSTGYILMHFSELVFWGSYDPEGMAPWQFAQTWGAYSIAAYAFLAIVRYFRVYTIWSLFLAGAAYGWMLEGILAQTLYGTPELPFPVTISWTGLAWHALISVLAGWYAVRKALLQNDCRSILAMACGLGLFSGAWALLWSSEPGHRVMVLVEHGRKDVALVHFALYAFLTTALLVLSYWASNAAEPAGFRPTPMAVSTVGGIALLTFLFITVRMRPVASLVLPLLLGAVYLALRRNRASGAHPDLVAALHGRVRLTHYLCLFFMPLVASALYGAALAADLRLPTGILILVVSTCAGVLMFAVSMVKVFRNEGGSRNADPAPAR
jgi:hypothetical protein